MNNKIYSLLLLWLVCVHASLIDLTGHSVLNPCTGDTYLYRKGSVDIQPQNIAFKGILVSETTKVYHIDFMVFPSQSQGDYKIPLEDSADFKLLYVLADAGLASLEVVECI